MDQHLNFRLLASKQVGCTQRNSSTKDWDGHLRLLLPNLSHGQYTPLLLNLPTPNLSTPNLHSHLSQPVIINLLNLGMSNPSLKLSLILPFKTLRVKLRLPPIRKLRPLLNQMMMRLCKN